MADKYLCWTDLSSKRYYAPANECMVSIPGVSSAAATVFVIGNTGNTINIASDVTTTVDVDVEVSGTGTPSATAASDSNADTSSIESSHEGYGYFNTTPELIFVVPTFYEALQWVKTGENSKALYGTE